MSGNDSDLTRLVARPRHDGVRLDRFLADATGLSRRRGRALIGDGLVWRNGEPVRIQSRILETGDVVDILLAAEEVAIAAGSELGPVSVLHDDGWVLVGDKPSGVLSQPAERQTSEELAFDQQVLLHLAANEGRRPFLRAAHRLDRVTSGTMLFARRGQATAPIAAAFRNGKAERWYLAVVEGAPEWSRRELKGPIGRARGHAWRFRVTEGGRPSRTEVHMLAPLDHGLSLVACRLRSGRTHQVRVHLSAEELPVLGDRLYGSSAAHRVTRPLLHAILLSLPHPSGEGAITVTAPVPVDLKAFIPPGLDLAAALAEIRSSSP